MRDEADYATSKEGGRHLQVADIPQRPSIPQHPRASSQQSASPQHATNSRVRDLRGRQRQRRFCATGRTGHVLVRRAGSLP